MDRLKSGLVLYGIGVAGILALRLAWDWHWLSTPVLFVCQLAPVAVLAAGIVRVNRAERSGELRGFEVIREKA